MDDSLLVVFLNPCHECEDTEYFEKNGGYFCTTCGTKYQGEHEMESEVDVTNRSFTYTKIQKGKKQKLVHDIRQPTEPVKKCNKYELFQALLKDQVEALIKLGAHPKLKDVVFQLWMKYLATTKIAFFDKHDKQNFIDKTLWKERKTLAEGKSPDETITKVEEEEMEIEDDEIEENKDNEIEDDVADEIDKHLSKRRRIKLPYTLAICYFGLLYTNPLITFKDLIRWVKEFKIPFCNAEEYLPKDYDVHYHKTFKAYKDPRTINIPMIYNDLRVIALYINPEDSPSIPLRLFVQKYTSKLNLPDDLHAISSKLVESSVTVLAMKRKTFLLTNVEVIAVSYVVVILKLLFGLDGHTERELSSYTRKLMTNIKDRHTLFDLEDWVRFMKEQMAETVSRSELATEDLASEEENKERDTNSKAQKVYGPLSKLSKIWDKRKKGFHSTVSDVTENDSSETNLKQKYFRDSSLQHIIHPETFLESLDQFKLASLHDVLRDSETVEEMENICKSSTLSQNNGGNTQPSENITRNLQVNENNGEHLQISGSENLHSIEYSNKNLETSSFNLDCKEDKISKIPSHSETNENCINQNGSSCNQSGDGEQGLESLSDSKTDSQKRHTMESNDITRLQQFLKTNFQTTRVRNVEQFDDVIQQIIFTRNTLHSNYVVGPKLRSSIYDEILNICSNLIYVTPYMVQRQVQAIEKSLFRVKQNDLGV